MKTTNAVKAFTLTSILIIGNLIINATAEEVIKDKAPDATASYTDTSWQTPLAAEFSKLDTSGNGLLKPNEASVGKTFNAKSFAKADVDHDGYIDQNEFIYARTGAWPVVAPVNPPEGASIESADNKMITADKQDSEPKTTKSSISKIGTVIDDSIITTKAKAKILANEELKSLQISVETHQGEVILSGFVDNSAAKAKAEEVVSGIEGVKFVKNGLEVRS